MVSNLGFQNSDTQNMGNRKLRKHIWVSEIRTPKILAIDNCESITENGNFGRKYLGFRNSDTQNMGNRKLRKHIWVSEIRTPKMLVIVNCEKTFGFPKFGHLKSQAIENQGKIFGFLNFGMAASHEIYIWCKTR